MQGVEVDVHSIGDAPDDLGVRHGRELLALVDAIHRDEPESIAAARDALGRVSNPDTVVDAIAVYANFQMMNRIADATGTPLDSFSVEPSAQLREALGLDDYVSKHLPAST